MLRGMRKIEMLIALMGVAVLAMCSQNEGPLPAGQVRATDAKADALMAQAQRLEQAGKHSAARSVLTQIVTDHDLAPCAPQARMMLGEIEEKLGDPREAFRQYGKVVEGYQSSELYEKALNRQLAIGTAAASGKLKGKVLWLWDGPMEEGKVVEWLQSVIKNAPYADMSATAASVLGNYLVKREKYDEAAAVYKKLVEDYPDSPYAPGAQLMVAKLWASSHTRGDNNLVNLDRAREAYEEFTLLYPNHKEVGTARSGVKEMQRLMVDQELEVGRYYLERAREYGPAVFCFESVIRQASANPEAAQKAKKLLVQAQAGLRSSTAPKS